VWTDQWLYWIAPLVGGAVGWVIYRFVSKDTSAEAEASA
jgi:glycerol uptake facilitator-like aquaporin